jgi:hypothetical protein
MAGGWKKEGSVEGWQEGRRGRGDEKKDGGVERWEEGGQAEGWEEGRRGRGMTGLSRWMGGKRAGQGDERKKGWVGG